MSSYKTIENNLWKASFPLVSGVLTSLIYEKLSSPSYMLDVHGEQFLFTSTETKFWRTVVFIIVTFLLIWAVIFAVIWLIQCLRKRFSYDKIKRVNAKDLVNTLDAAKVSVVELYPVLCNESGDASCTYLVKLHGRDLARIILLLHGKFLPHNQKMRRTIENYFRNPNHSSIITIDRSISGYEFSSMITILKKMVSTVESTARDDKLLEKDCNEMKKNLDELFELSERIKSKTKK